MTVTVCVPAKNEEQNLAEILPTLLPYGDEILVVDGHSIDGTREVARGLGVRVVMDNGRGKGDGQGGTERDRRGR